MEKSIVIIGAGMAGLSAGCFARMNGYRTTIVEMHSKPGGLCTAWERKGYVFDACIHWLVGSKPGNDPMRQGWEELGAVQGRMIIDHDVWMVIEDKDGKTFTVFEDAHRLENEMLRLAPEDAKAIKEFTSDIIKLSNMPSGPPDEKPGDKKPGLLETAGGFIGFIPTILTMIKYSSMDVKQLAKKFKNPFLSFAIGEIFGGIQEFTAAGLIFTLAWMHNRNAGYPIGGSLEFAKAIEDRYLKLGGEVLYNSAVEKINVVNGEARGVRLKSGREIAADIVISAADGHATIYDMLGGAYKDRKIDGIYSGYKRFPSIMQVSMGVAMDLTGEPQSVDFPISKPISAGSMSDDRISLRIYAFDRTMAPEGCTALTTYISGDYEYWTKLRAADKKKYNDEKMRVGNEVVEAVNAKYPGFRERLQVLDVATPATYVRYTGNWMGSFEGWLMTPKNIMAKIPRTLPGLKDFYMIGQWVQPGGGLPSGLMTGKEIIRNICKKDGKDFVTTKG
jgi:phytoene dehydrogenase-like protein